MHGHMGSQQEAPGQPRIAFHAFKAAQCWSDVKTSVEPDFESPPLQRAFVDPDRLSEDAVFDSATGRLVRQRKGLVDHREK
jgi:hypothetical protein